MYMDMNGNRNGSSSVSTNDVLNDFMVSPTKMSMEMHMLGLMYAPNDSFTLMTMVPIIKLSMDHATRMGREFTTESSGLGDIGLTGLIPFYEDEMHILHFNAGLTLPSGEIDERDDTPAMAQAQLPYPMQLGSGTVDLKPGITYNGYHGRTVWGAQGIGTIRLGRNDNEYSLGDRFESSIWVGYEFFEWMSGSVRTAWSIWGDIDGADPLLNPMMVPTADPNRRGGRTVEMGVGLNFLIPSGSLEGLRIAVEYLFPLYRDLNGPQLETDATWIFGGQMTF